MMISFRGLLLLRSREFFIFQIADVHLLHSATRWYVLGQIFSLLELFLKFEYQRRVAAGHLFGDEAAEVRSQPEAGP